MKQVFRYIGFTLIFLLFTLVLFSHGKPVQAQAQPWYFPSFESFMGVLDTRSNKGEMQVEGYIPLTNVISQYFLSGLITGGSTLADSPLYYKKSALANIGNATAFMYDNPPASTYAFVRDMGQSLGFIPKTAYAQGIGFSGMQPLLPIWKAFRNIAYLLLAIVMVVVGFMVMFRKKIDPKTVVTVQNALPRIVVTLLLITFSYAIVGLMIDLMYLLTALGISLLASQAGTQDLANEYLNGGFWALVKGVFAPVAHLNPLAKIGEGIWQKDLQQIWDNLGKGLVYIYTAGYFGLGPVFQLLLSLAYLFGFIRIFFMLLSAYINIIISLIVAPIQILFDAIPGGNNFSSWIKNLITNIIPFPITIFLLVLGDTLTKPVGTLWQPPLLPQIGVAGGTGGFAIAVIWLGLILTIPSIVKGIKETMKAKAPIPVGPSAILGPFGAVGGTATTTLSQAYYIDAMLKQSGGGGLLSMFGIKRKQ